MSFRKITTIKVSERVFDIVCDELDLYASEYGVKIDGYLEVFNNCREQGYVLHVESIDWDNENRTKKSLYIWACEARSSDEIMIVWSNDYPHNGMFSEDDYDNRCRYFFHDELQKASRFIIDKVKDAFEQEFANK